ncbi:L-lactate permease [Corynebacterium pyruviciproducens]|uniref:L-lactate permease n=1 Tax=Corynebacterium pyruviciproducens TaxID=598660 RepID=UPI002456C571|nr:L-lactate permease [Corynebacterium pyruviciproducens]
MQHTLLAAGESVHYFAQTFQADTLSVANNTWLTALVGTLPLVAFFIFLMTLKWKAHTSAIGAVIVSLALAIFVFGMPVSYSVASLAQGVAFGLFPVVFIIWMAVWLYDLTVSSNRFEDLRLIFSKIGRGDMRVQAMLIGFSFGGLLEALAGFGAPVAIVAAMLLSLGMKPMKAITTTLVANTAPVAFGAMAIPVTTAALLTGLDQREVAGMTGLLMMTIAVVVPFILTFIMDGVRGFKQVWPMALVLGISFGGGQYLASNFFSYELTDVVACLLSLAIGIAFLRVWKPTTPEDQASQVDTSRANEMDGKRTFLALFPYLLVVVVFAIAKLWTLGINIPKALASTDVKFQWPVIGGNLLNPDGSEVTGTLYNFNWLSNPGTLLFISGLITVAVYSAYATKAFPMSFGQGFGDLGKGAYKMRFSALTIASVMGLAYVMNYSGQTAAIGAALATAGTVFPLISPILGWVGTAVTGSATSSNALFAKMQATAANEIGANPVLLTAANSGGAVIGKMFSPQTLTIAATAVHMENGESKIMRKVFPYSMGLLVYVCIVVFLFSLV